MEFNKPLNRPYFCCIAQLIGIHKQSHSQASNFVLMVATVDFYVIKIQSNQSITNQNLHYGIILRAKNLTIFYQRHVIFANNTKCC